ncbi:MAG TPA: N-acetyltransferase [Terriglobales bacterium]|nr:N-acetyltransferase [Terriglobales bacterium]
MRYRIRDYKPEDFDRLHTLDQECFPPGIAYSRRELAYYIKRPHAFTLVAEEKNKAIAGFIVASSHPKKMGHIITIDTDRKLRRSGLGTLLMNAAETRLREIGCEVVFLEVAVNNTPAIKFYKKLGYSILKTLMGYYQGKLDGFLMIRRFSEEQGVTGITK